MMGIFSGNPVNEPMHYGEVIAVWSYLASKNSMIAGYQTLINHTGDEDLKSLLEDMVRTAKQEKEQVEKVLKVNGIALPPAPPERPDAVLETIPPGARFNDPEISAMASRDLGVGLVACSQAMSQCVREDIGLMFGQFHVSKTQFLARMLRLNKEKGWLIVPPLHLQSPELATV
jgi:hypothetical protein